jgi:hypothetical protein
MWHAVGVGGHCELERGEGARWRAGGVGGHCELGGGEN